MDITSSKAARFTNPSITNSRIDFTAGLIGTLPIAEIRETLLSAGMSEVDAFLCYQAAKLLIKNGFYRDTTLPIV